LNKNENTEEKGILVETVVTADTRQDTGGTGILLYQVLRIVFLLLTAAGFSCSLFVPLSVPVAAAGIAVTGAAISLVYAALYLLMPRQRNIITAALLALLAVTAVIFRRQLALGLENLYNLYATLINGYYGSHVSLAAIDSVGTGLQMFSIVWILALCMIPLTLCCIVWLNAMPAAVMMAVPIAMYLAVGEVPPLAWMLCMLAGLVGMFFLQFTKIRDPYRANVVLVQMGTKALTRLRSQTAAIAAAVVLAVSLAAGLVVGPQINRGYESQTQLREDIRSGEAAENLQEFWKKLIRGEWDWLPFDIIRSSGVHGGRLSNVKEVRSYDELHLYLDIAADLTSPMYIRGYVGTNYTGEGWKGLTDEQKTASQSSGMTVGQLSAQYYQILTQLQQSGTANVYGPLQYVITNVGANDDYSYIPYGADVSQFEAGASADIYTKDSTDRQILSLQYLNTQKLSNLDALEKAGAANTADEAYRQYVRDTYLTVPEEGLDQFRAEFSGMTFSSIADAVQYVRTTLADRAEYTTVPGSTPRDQDFVEYFLYTNKKGYCTHFASAAVLMFRMFGIPARYVEGYLTTELSAEGGPNEIMDDAAHAWAEIYIDGAGWIPIEVTPGFVNEDDMIDDRQPETEEPTSAPVSEDTIDDIEPTTEQQLEDDLQEPTTSEESGLTIEPPTQQQETETQPEQEQNTESPTPQTGSTEQDSVLNKLLPILLPILIILAAIALIILLFRSRRAHILAARRKAYRGDPAAAVRAALAQTEKVSTDEGLLLDEYTDQEAALKKYPFLTEDLLAWYQSLSMEAAFSNHTFDAQTRSDAVKFVSSFTESVYKAKSRAGQFAMKWIACDL
jgi:transglutaminase-like putative cysteine protease